MKKDIAIIIIVLVLCVFASLIGGVVYFWDDIFKDDEVKDCVFTEQWGACTHRGGSEPTCGAGAGVQTNNYIITGHPNEFGKACPVGGNTRSCDLPECPNNVIGVRCTGYYALDEACTNTLIQYPDLCGSQYHSGEVPFTVRTEGDVCPERNLTRSKTCPFVACPAETEAETETETKTETETETEMDLDCKGEYDVQSYCNELRESMSLRCDIEYEAYQVPFTVTREALPGGSCFKAHIWSHGICPAVC